MAGTKNNDKLIWHLQNIFTYAPEDGPAAAVEQYEGRVDAFAQHLRKCGFEISRRSLYGYINGSQHMPPDFMLPLRDWSLKVNVTAAVEFINAYELRMPESERERIREQIKREDEAIAEHEKRKSSLKDTLKD